MFETITFTQHTPTGAGPWFDARSLYVERVWTSTLGCTAIMVLRAGAALLAAQNPISVDGEQLAASLGQRLASGKRSCLHHTLQRLELYGLAGLNDPTVVLQTLLPPLPAKLLARTPGCVQAVHHSLLAAHRAQLETTSR